VHCCSTDQDHECSDLRCANTTPSSKNMSWLPSLHQWFNLLCVGTLSLVFLQHFGPLLYAFGSKFVWVPLQQNLSPSLLNFLENVIWLGGFLNKLKEFQLLWLFYVSVIDIVKKDGRNKKE